MSNRAWLYTLPVAMYVAAWLSFHNTGITAWLPVIIGFIIIPLAELFLRPETANLSEDEEKTVAQNRIYDYFLYAVVLLQYLALVLFLRSMQDDTLSTFDRIGRIVSMGLLCGTFGINVGHELGHRVNKSEQVLAKISLLSSLYMHFMTEHNKGHHKYVGTPQDPTSARYGENLYSFWARSFFGTITSAWRIARKEQLEKHHSLLQNEMVQFQMVQITFCVLIGLVFGWIPLLYFIGAAAIGILLLNTVNYIEHYGLTRKSTGHNTYERAMPHHSWNSNHSIGRYMLFELSRHSDHHYLASRKYQVLRHHDDSPELPTGYPGSMLLSLVPPLWFSVMNKKVKELNIN